MAKRVPRKSRRLTEEPTCNCILMCDDVLMSAKNKHTLAGVIGVIGVAHLPIVLGNYVAYVRISNVYGTQRIRVGLEHTAEAPLFEFMADLTGPQDPLGVHTLVVPIRPFQVESAGRYFFSARSENGSLLAGTPILIKNLNESQ